MPNCALIPDPDPLSLIPDPCRLAGAAAATQVMRSMLVGVEPTDPATFASIAVLFLAVASVASVACWLPARRAARLDPLAALREN